MRKINNITFGLFNARGIYFWRNIKDIPILFERIVFTLKHGYSPQAQWETFAWFVNVMKEIISNYRHNRSGTPVLYYELSFDDNKIEYNKVLDKMLSLLDQMDEDNYGDVNYTERYELMDSAKNEFFELFSEYFYGLWD